MYQALDTTLAQLNRLNRSLESVIELGNEFGSVEALWSQFEGVIGSAGGSSTQMGAGNAEMRKDEEEAIVGASAAADEEEGDDGKESTVLQSPPVVRGLRMS